MLVVVVLVLVVVELLVVPGLQPSDAASAERIGWSSGV